MRNLLIIASLLLFTPISYGMRYTQYPVFVSANMTGTVTSSAIDTQQLSNLSYHLYWTGATASGSFIIDGSNQIVNIPPTGLVGNYVTQWTPVSGTTFAFAGSSITSYLYNLADIGFRYMRVRFAPASGSGTLTGVFFGKGP